MTHLKEPNCPCVEVFITLKGESACNLWDLSHIRVGAGDIDESFDTPQEEPTISSH